MFSLQTHRYHIKVRPLAVLASVHGVPRNAACPVPLNILLGMPAACRQEVLCNILDAINNIVTCCRIWQVGTLLEGL